MAILISMNILRLEAGICKDPGLLCGLDLPGAFFMEV